MTEPTDAGSAASDGAGKTPATITGRQSAGDRRPRRLISGATGVALLTVGALVAGVAIGWVLHARLAPQPTPTVAAGTVVVPLLPPAVAPTSAAVSIPDVRGLSQADAAQAIADSGAGVAGLVIAKKPFVGPQGFVVAQDPIGGSPPAPKMTLVLPIPATMPNLAGRSEADARAALEALGAAVTEQHTYQQGSPAGTVISSKPAIGATLTQDAVLVIADPPASRFLVELTSAGPCGSDPSAAISGTTYSKGISCPAQTTTDSTETVWLLDRKVAGLVGTVGIDDRSAPGVDALITVAGDGGKQLFQTRLTYGKAGSINVNTTGVLRLTVTAQLVSNLALNAPRVDLGDVVMTGADADLATLVGS